jgi:hypothetical protein
MTMINDTLLLRPLAEYQNLVDMRMRDAAHKSSNGNESSRQASMPNIIFEYSTNPERHALTVQKFLDVQERCKSELKNLLTLEKVTYFSNLQE